MNTLDSDCRTYVGCDKSRISLPSIAHLSWMGDENFYGTTGSNFNVDKAFRLPPIVSLFNPALFCVPPPRRLPWPLLVCGEPTVVNKKSKTSTTYTAYTCPQCFKTFSRPSNLKIHSYSHTGERPFVCSARGCGRSFSVRSNLRRHMHVHGL